MRHIPALLSSNIKEDVPTLITHSFELEFLSECADRLRDLLVLAKRTLVFPLAAPCFIAPDDSGNGIDDKSAFILESTGHVELLAGVTISSHSDESAMIDE